MCLTYFFFQYLSLERCLKYTEALVMKNTTSTNQFFDLHIVEKHPSVYKLTGTQFQIIYIYYVFHYVTYIDRRLKNTSLI